MNNLITVSRLSTLQSCQRAHYWKYECGLHRQEDADALRFGSAWHRAMEARWQNKTYEESLSLALGNAAELDELQSSTIAALLLGYYLHHHATELVKEIHAEIEFALPLESSRTFQVGGKIDGLAVLLDGSIALIEHKTTSDSLDPDSDYWLRLRFNSQLCQYVLAARELGWNVTKVIYDVTRKPSIKPKQIARVDENGAKIVHDSEGQRVLKKDGSPRETGDTEKGYFLQSDIETADQFSDRLIQDCKDRPEFYFARREAAILDQDLEEFQESRYELGKSILSMRARQRVLTKPENAWPRNVSANTCKYCDFQNFCLQNLTINPAQPPAGFTIAFNPELNQAV